MFCALAKRREHVGTRNAAVLPDPVCAHAIRSRPAVTTEIECRYMREDHVSCHPLLLKKHRIHILVLEWG